MAKSKIKQDAAEKAAEIAGHIMALGDAAREQHQATERLSGVRDAAENALARHFEASVARVLVLTICEPENIKVAGVCEVCDKVQLRAHMNRAGVCVPCAIVARDLFEQQANTSWEQQQS